MRSARPQRQSRFPIRGSPSSAYASWPKRAPPPISPRRPTQGSPNAEDYHAHRIALGVPEGGKDYAFADTFPHEALFDQLDGVSFAKGCFVGQEVVSRMEHRRTGRKRVVPVVGESRPARDPAPRSKPATSSSARLAPSAAIAAWRSCASTARRKQSPRALPLSAGAVPVRIELPPFATFTLEPQPASA